MKWPWLTGTMAALLTPWAQWSVEVRKDRKTNRQEFVKLWMQYANHGSIRNLTKKGEFPSLLRALSSPAKRELEILLATYETKCTELDGKAFSWVDDGSGVTEIKFYHSPWSEEVLNAEKEKIGIPIRHFLFTQIAALREKWNLL
jgi:hypothetical protein